MEDSSKSIAGSVDSNQSNELQLLAAALAEAKDRQSKVVGDMKDAHTRQLELLKAAIQEERKESLQYQKAFEDALRTKYDHMVQALQDKIRAEQEVRMQRSLEDMERNVRLESERARQMFEAQQSAEAVMSSKFKELVADLRKSWEEEEASRAKQLEERLRGHYSAVLEHMESQLQMALRLQDEADRQWMEDVEARNRQQVATIRAFEEKCRRLYDTRLAEYVTKTEQQLGAYEEQLLQVGANLATERTRFESRLRRLKMACGRWKAEYQREVHNKYREMAAVLEARYMSEVEALLTELSGARAQLSQVEHAVQLKERDLFDERRRADTADKRATEADRDRRAGRAQLITMRESLMKLWKGLGTSNEEKIQVLVSLLDAADPSPELSRKFEAVQSKLGARLPIIQMTTRRQLVEHKLQSIAAASATATDRTELLASKSTLLKELAELNRSIEVSVREYEQAYGERFVLNSAIAGPGAMGGGSTAAAQVAASPGSSGAGGGPMSSPMSATMISSIASSAAASKLVSSNAAASASGTSAGAAGTTTSSGTTGFSPRARSPTGRSALGATTSTSASAASTKTSGTTNNAAFLRPRA